MFSKANIFTAVWTIIAISVAYVVIKKVVDPQLNKPSATPTAE